MTGIEEGTQVVSEVELKLAEHSHLPDDLDDLQAVHQDLLQIQMVIQDHQVCYLPLHISSIVFHYNYL